MENNETTVKNYQLKINEQVNIIKPKPQLNIPCVMVSCFVNQIVKLINISKMERKEGYYWVYLFSYKNFSYEGWNVARWDGSSFWYDGHPYNENCFSQIDERKIERLA